METKYIVKRFDALTPVRFTEHIGCSRPLRKITIECLSNGMTTYEQTFVVYDTQTQQAETVASNPASFIPCPLNPVMCILQTNLTPETSQGMVMVGSDCEAFSKYEYIFQSPTEVGIGEYRFQLSTPEVFDPTQSTKNEYQPLIAPSDNFYVGLKIEMVYA